MVAKGLIIRDRQMKETRKWKKKKTDSTRWDLNLWPLDYNAELQPQGSRQLIYLSNLSLLG